MSGTRDSVAHNIHHVNHNAMATDDSGVGHVCIHILTVIHWCKEQSPGVPLAIATHGSARKKYQINSPGVFILSFIRLNQRRLPSSMWAARCLVVVALATLCVNGAEPGDGTDKLKSVVQDATPDGDATT